MTPVGWLALAGLFLISALPTAALARADGLAGGGRLGATARPSVRGWARASQAAPGVGIACGTAVLAAVGWWGGIALTIAAAAATGVAVVFGRDAVRARRESRRHRDLVTAVRVLAGELAAGGRPADALAAAASAGESATELLGPAAEAQRTGHDASAVLADSVEPGVRALAVAWRLGAATGAALAEVVDRVAVDLAARDTRRRAVTVAVAGPRSSAVLLAALPVVGIALGAGMGARPLEFLLTDPVGRVLCCGGVVLDALGLLWIRRIVTRVQRR